MSLVAARIGPNRVSLTRVRTAPGLRKLRFWAFSCTQPICRRSETLVIVPDHRGHELAALIEKLGVAASGHRFKAGGHGVFLEVLGQIPIVGDLAQRQLPTLDLRGHLGHVRRGGAGC